MKRLWIAIFLMLLAFALAITGCCVVNSQAGELIKKFDAAVITAGKGQKEDTIKSAKELKEYWHKRQTVFKLFVRHFDLEDFNTALDDLTWLAENEKYDAFLSNCRICRIKLEHIAESETINFNNIF